MDSSVDTVGGTGQSNVDHQAGHHDGPHIAPMRMYISIVCLLFVMTAVTVGAAFVELGALGTPIALAIAITFRLFFSGEAVDLAYTVVLCSVAVNELLGPRLLRGLLVDAGEIREDIRFEVGA